MFSGIPKAHWLKHGDACRPGASQSARPPARAFQRTQSPMQKRRWRGEAPADGSGRSGEKRIDGLHVETAHTRRAVQVAKRICSETKKPRKASAIPNTASSVIYARECGTATGTISQGVLQGALFGRPRFVAVFRGVGIRGNGIHFRFLVRFRGLPVKRRNFKTPLFTNQLMRHKRSPMRGAWLPPPKRCTAGSSAPRMPGKSRGAGIPRSQTADQIVVLILPSIKRS